MDLAQTLSRKRANNRRAGTYRLVPVPVPTYELTDLSAGLKEILQRY